MLKRRSGIGRARSITRIPHCGIQRNRSLTLVHRGVPRAGVADTTARRTRIAPNSGATAGGRILHPVGVQVDGTDFAATACKELNGHDQRNEQRSTNTLSRG
jgi:hypothetical protein